MLAPRMICPPRLAALAFALVLIAPRALPAQAAPAAAPLTIYPVGDSITAGYGPSIQGGYRAFLFQKFKDAGLPVQLIGTSTLNSAIAVLTDNNQTHHEGHGGYRIDQILKDLDGNDGGDSTFGGYWMTGGHGTGRAPLSPDIVLVHVGTNDILQKTPLNIVEDRLHKLLDWLAQHTTNSKVFVARILPINRDYALNDTKALNAWMVNQLNDPAYAGRFFVVDLYSRFIDPAGHITHLPDGIHPDSDGYRLMADTWYQALLVAKAIPPSPQATP